MKILILIIAFVIGFPLNYCIRKYGKPHDTYMKPPKRKH